MRFSVLVNRRSVADSRRQFAGCFLRRSVNGGIASNGRISMATFAPGDDVDAYCGECGQVLGDVILVTVQGSEKS